MSPKCPSKSPQQEATASSTSYLILGLKEFTKVVESPTRQRSSLRCFETTPSIQANGDGDICFSYAGEVIIANGNGVPAGSMVKVQR